MVYIVMRDRWLASNNKRRREKRKRGKGEKRKPIGLWMLIHHNTISLLAHSTHVTSQSTMRERVGCGWMDEEDGYALLTITYS